MIRLQESLTTKEMQTFGRTGELWWTDIYHVCPYKMQVKVEHNVNQHNEYTT